MKTLVIAGSDTGVGKTWVTGALAALLKRHGFSVQLVKPVETGVAEGAPGDALAAAEAAGLGESSAHTLRQFPQPLAPVEAARQAGETLQLEALACEIEALPDADWRIVEGAGGIASPLQLDGADWADMAMRLEAWRVVVVVEDRLGAINQARLSYDYARSRGLQAGIWLNAPRPLDLDVFNSNRRALQDCRVPLWGETGTGDRPGEADLSWLGL